jgi:gamma-glutamylcyclotransferase (GGCT)/AIG2-like uncharacterized protein YtfP
MLIEHNKICDTVILLTIMSDNINKVDELNRGIQMYIFAYGIASAASQDNQMYSRMMRLIAEEAWLLNAALYVTAIDIPALTYGKDKVTGKRALMTPMHLCIVQMRA